MGKARYGITVIMDMSNFKNEYIAWTRKHNAKNGMEIKRKNVWQFLSREENLHYGTTQRERSK